MKYIPVEFVPISLPWLITFIALLAIGIMAAVISRKKGLHRVEFLSAFFAVFSGVGVLFLLLTLTPRIQSEAGRVNQQDELKAAISKSYGLDLRDDEVEALKYPQARPEKGLETFGTISTVAKVSGDYERTDITLVWDSGKMVLAAPDGDQKLQPLKTRG